jgi:hypothetical protein
MDLRLQEELEAAEHWANERVNSVQRDGYVTAVEAALTTRVLAMILNRADRLEKRQGQIIALLRAVVGCLLLIVGVLLAGP